MKIAILGYGKMGRAVEEVALAKGHEIVAIVNSKAGWQKHSTAIRQAEVAIEFSTPDAVAENLSGCFRLGLPVVCGTTAWEHRLAEIKKQCMEREGALFVASNFSLGVNIFFKLNRQLASMMDKFNQYNPVIEETHHTGKLDKPSGTAKQLANDVVAEMRRKHNWLPGQHAGTVKIPVISRRLEDVPGTHVIRYESAEDILEIRHTAISRTGFARGAVMAAEWLPGKKGFYTMSHLLADVI